MADGDSSDFTFCKVSSEENDGQLGSPKAIPVASMSLEDVHVDNAKTAKKDGLKANDSDKDRSGNSTSVSTQDSNMKEPITQTSGGAESNVSSQAKSSSKKPAVWKKVPFEKGYSQMDWLKLTRTHPDLAGALVLRARQRAAPAAVRTRGPGSGGRGGARPRRSCGPEGSWHRRPWWRGGVQLRQPCGARPRQQLLLRWRRGASAAAVGSGTGRGPASTHLSVPARDVRKRSKGGGKGKPAARSQSASRRHLSSSSSWGRARRSRSTPAPYSWSPSSASSATDDEVAPFSSSDGEAGGEEAETRTLFSSLSLSSDSSEFYRSSTRKSHWSTIARRAPWRALPRTGEAAPGDAFRLLVLLETRKHRGPTSFKGD
ncbi:cytochrome b5 domain-containing protein RLF-like [Panicum miliaceum]|uniref:Cytochrome b5 domain-containing protein RLF-like n=1 Tax=Panicum miliaceum TaxID=4540 RepID=A0A3L6QR41_PANMI|nr:cytochrome b5 domain-containing protein RLF-like [Panicum miliaceum]